MAKAKKKTERDRTVTERNRKRKHAKADAHRARLIARTQALIGKHVLVRKKDFDRPLVGTVLEVISKENSEYPHDAERHSGNYLRIRTTVGDIKRSRHRVKAIDDPPTH